MNNFVTKLSGTVPTGRLVAGRWCPPLGRADCVIFQPARGICVTAGRPVITALAPSDTPTLGNPTENRLNKIQFPPFVKDLFQGVFNKSILSYAEVLNYERYFALEEQTKQIRKFLDKNQESVSNINTRGAVPQELLTKLRDLDLFGLTVPRDYGGLELMNTETVRLLEELGRDASLAEMFNMNEFFGVKALIDYGSEEQKSRYLPKVAAGELWTAFCLAEKGCGSDPNSVETKARWIEEEGCFQLNGEKTWVCNGLRAGLFLVFAKTSTRNYIGEEDQLLSAFLVDRNTPGVEISQPYNLAGYNGLQPCTLTFTKAQVPVSGLLGVEGEGLTVLQSLLHQQKYFMAAGVLQRMRTLLNLTTEHVLGRKQYGSKLADFELVQHTLAKCAGHVYALESMLYLTAGLGDVGIKPDIEVESAIVKQFAVQTSDYVTRSCLGLVGASTNLQDSPYQTYLAENQVLQSWQGSSNVLKCFIAISGIIHISNNIGEELMKSRNPGLHPIKYMKHTWDTRRHKTDSFPMKHKLDHYVHPRMAKCAADTEWAVHKLAFCSQDLLLKQGANLQITEAYLERVSDLAMETYAMVASLTRASRSYIVGQLHAEYEVSLAIPFVFDARLRAKTAAWQCMFYGKDQGNRDGFLKRAGSYMTEQKGYFPVSPITKNQF